MEQHVLADPHAMFSLSAAHLRNVSFMTWCAALCPNDRVQELFDLVAAKVQNSPRFTKTLMVKNDHLYLPKHLRELFLPFYLSTYQRPPLFYGHFESSEWAVIVEFDGRHLYRVPTGMLSPGIKINKQKIKQQIEWEARRECFVFLSVLQVRGVNARNRKRLLLAIGAFMGADLKRKLRHFTPITAWRRLPPMTAPTYVVGRKSHAERANTKNATDLKGNQKKQRT
jgi:hypothetical protein